MTHDAPPLRVPEPQPPAHAVGAADGAKLAAAIGAVAAGLVLAMTPAFEGTVLRGYRDIGGVVTACTGHTETAELGRSYSRAQCQELLASDLIKHNTGLRACVRVAMAPHVHAALLDWAFNIGVGAACRSTVVRKLNAGDVAGACRALEDWVFVAGRDCRKPENSKFCGGIVRRRAAERALCEGQLP